MKFTILSQACLHVEHRDPVNPWNSAIIPPVTAAGSTTPMPADCAAGDSGTLSIGVSIVLYRTPVTAVAELLQQLLTQGARPVYLIDHTPQELHAFQSWGPPPP